MAGYEEFTYEMFAATIELVALDVRTAWAEYLAAGGEYAPPQMKQRTFDVIVSSMAELHALERGVHAQAGTPGRPD